MPAVKAGRPAAKNNSSEPKSREGISVYFEPHEIKEVEAVAKEDMRPRAQMIRVLALEAIAARRKPTVPAAPV